MGPEVELYSGFVSILGDSFMWIVLFRGGLFTRGQDLAMHMYSYYFFCILSNAA